MQEPTHDRTDDQTRGRPSGNQSSEPGQQRNRAAPKQPAPKQPTPKNSVPSDQEQPNLPDRPFDETDAAWGEYPQSSDDWLREQRPPHYE